MIVEYSRLKRKRTVYVFNVKKAQICDGMRVHSVAQTGFGAIFCFHPDDVFFRDVPADFNKTLKKHSAGTTAWL